MILDKQKNSVIECGGHSPPNAYQPSLPNKIILHRYINNEKIPFKKPSANKKAPLFKSLVL